MKNKKDERNENLKNEKRNQSLALSYISLKRLQTIRISPLTPSVGGDRGEGKETSDVECKRPPSDRPAGLSRLPHPHLMATSSVAAARRERTIKHKSLVFISDEQQTFA